MLNLLAWNAEEIAKQPLPGASAVIRMADEEDMLAPIADHAKVLHQLDLIFNDSESTFDSVRSPQSCHAKQILDFLGRVQADCRVEHLIAQCQAGIGRSRAVVAAISKLRGDNPRLFWNAPTHNRKLYRTLLELAGQPEHEPKVSIAVRVKYDPRAALRQFLLSVINQRWDNWEIVCYADPEMARYVQEKIEDDFCDNRIKLVTTPGRNDRWGHRYRQYAFEHCTGDWIGTNNDDNYLTPGYMEQLVTMGEHYAADVVACRMLHRYSFWNPTPPGSDLCSWLARGGLVHCTPWTGMGFLADREYLDALQRNSNGKVLQLQTPLVVKN